jgi:hypothetical protein
MKSNNPSKKVRPILCIFAPIVLSVLILLVRALDANAQAPTGANQPGCSASHSTNHSWHSTAGKEPPPRSLHWIKTLTDSIIAIAESS